MLKTHLGRLNELPRARLVETETPIQAMENLSRRTGGAALYVKRDDLTGTAFGGNKLRQLEYYFGEAQAQSADTILITGAVQSNFMRLAAATACRLNMACHLQLEERVPDPDETYRKSGNVLLDKLLGATLYTYPDGEDEAGADARIGELAEELKSQGKKPYIIPLSPGKPPKGALGYVNGALEILAQIDEQDLAIDEIVVASGSGHTHAGLLFGLRAVDSDLPVRGICVRRAADQQRPRIQDHCAQIAALLAVENPVNDSDIDLNDSFLAPGYGRLGDAAGDALVAAARTEALILDPVYTAKTMAGALARARTLGQGKRILFIHTGGNPALFAYADKLSGLF